MLRFEFDRVVAYHPYRTMQPWDVPGAVKILQVDGVNGALDATGIIRDRILRLEQDILGAAVTDGLPAVVDNHYGFTVAVVGGDGRSTYYQLRFSDGSLYVWLIPYSVGLYLEERKSSK